MGRREEVERGMRSEKGETRRGRARKLEEIGTTRGNRGKNYRCESEEKGRMKEYGSEENREGVRHGIGRGKGV